MITYVHLITSEVLNNIYKIFYKRNTEQIISFHFYDEDLGVLNQPN